MTFMIWGPIWLLWWFVFFLRLTIFNSFFLAAVKFGLAGPLFCYEAVLVLFVLALVLDDHYPSSKISMVEGSLNMAAVLVMHAFSGFVQIGFYRDIKLWETLLRNRTVEEAEQIIENEEQEDIA